MKIDYSNNTKEIELDREKQTTKRYYISGMITFVLATFILLYILLLNQTTMQMSCNGTGINFDSLSNEMINMSHYDTTLNKHKIAFQSANPTFTLNNSQIYCQGKITTQTYLIGLIN